MVQVNASALATLEAIDQTYDMRSSLPSHLGQMQARLGQSVEALHSATSSRELRLKDPEADLREVAWSEHNIAQIYTTFGPLESALEWHKKAVSTWETWADSQNNLSRTAPAVIRVGLGRCYMFMKHFEEAKELLDSAYTDFKKMYLRNWAMAAA